MNKADSEVIKIIRFPLAVLVVLIHSFTTVEGFDITSVNYAHLSGADCYSLLGISISRVLAQVAVPFFFFISGYLFYLNYNQWSWKKWEEKLKRRLHTLLIPYLVWISIAVFEVVGLSIAAYFIKGRSLETIYEWFHNIGGLSGIFWSDISHIEPFTNIFGWESYMTYPLLMPMWFIRDLMVVVLLSPFIWFALKKIPYISLLLLCLLWIVDAGTKVPGLSLISLFMFAWGGYFSIKNLCFTDAFKRIRKYVLYTLFALFFAASVYFGGRDTQIGQIVLHIWIIVAIPAICNIACWIIGNRKRTTERLTTLSDSTFFIFAAHGRHISYVYNALWTIFGIGIIENKISAEYADSNLALCILSYLLTPVITILLCYYVYKLFKRYLPLSIMKLLNGR